MLLTPALAAGLISSEVESGGWQLLQMTPLSARKILIGKLASVVWPLLLILVSTLPGYSSWSTSSRRCGCRFARS